MRRIMPAVAAVAICAGIVACGSSSSSPSSSAGGAAASCSNAAIQKDLYTEGRS